jgi:hypothetical protein
MTQESKAKGYDDRGVIKSPIFYLSSYQPLSISHLLVAVRVGPIAGQQWGIGNVAQWGFAGSRIAGNRVKLVTTHSVRFNLYGRE